MIKLYGSYLLIYSTVRHSLLYYLPLIICMSQHVKGEYENFKSKFFYHNSSEIYTHCMNGTVNKINNNALPVQAMLY